MSTTSPDRQAAHPTVACHLGLHDWMTVRDDEFHAHFRCQHCDHVKASNASWWEFAAAGR